MSESSQIPIEKYDADVRHLFQNLIDNLSEHYKIVHELIEKNNISIGNSSIRFYVTIPYKQLCDYANSQDYRDSFIEKHIDDHVTVCVSCIEYSRGFTIMWCGPYNIVTFNIIPDLKFHSVHPEFGKCDNKIETYYAS